MKKQSIRQIAKIHNYNRSAIYRWLKKFNIPTRSISEANHLIKANYCNLSDIARQWIDGELLGDGSLQPRSKHSASFTYTSKHKEYIEYVSNTLKSFRIKQAGKIRKRYHKDFNCYDYNYCSLSYKELLSIRKRWYPNGKKLIPRNLELTPLVLRQEMIGDGCLKHSKNGKSFIILSTHGFPIEDVGWLVSQLNELGFKSSRQPSENSIYISTYSTKQFLKYIGNKSPTKCYDYKFNYQGE